MRKILFRGKRIDSGEWVYGYYVPVCFGRFPCKPAIVPESDGTWEPIEVKKETVGQYIGLTDNSGKKVFEGDIVKGCWSTVFEVYFDEDYLQYRADGCSREIDYYGESDKLKVIGNIHDNPELLEGKP